jgi:hypothetical protein
MLKPFRFVCHPLNTTSSLDRILPTCGSRESLLFQLPGRIPDYSSFLDTERLRQWIHVASIGFGVPQEFENAWHELFAVPYLTPLTRAVGPTPEFHTLHLVEPIGLIKAPDVLADSHHQSKLVQGGWTQSNEKAHR